MSYQDTRWGVLLFCRDTVSVFCAMYERTNNKDTIKHCGYLQRTELLQLHDLRALLTHLSNINNVRGVMVIVVGNGHGDTSSNPGRD